ncbi:chromate efflux transporter [soil metagenome]
MEDAKTPPPLPPATLGALGFVALLTGLLGFGGGFVVIGRIHRYVVVERKWISEEAFLEHTGIASALPGTTAGNLYTLLGATLCGPLGATVATVFFLLPSVILMIAFGVFYDALRDVGGLAAFFEGMGAAVAPVILAVAISLRTRALRTPLPWVVAALSFAVLVTKLLPLVAVVLIAGFLGAARSPKAPAARAFPFALGLGGAAAATVVGSVSALTLLLVFARIGIATFGGGYAMIPEIAHEVTSRHWMDERSFADAIAFGQITPGPVAISATFVGYRVGGPLGALAATVGIFGPPFALCVIAARSLSAFRTNRFVRGFLEGVAPAVVGIVAAAAFSVARVAIIDVRTAVLAAICMVVLVAKPKTSALPLLFGAAIAGFVWKHFAP